MPNRKETARQRLTELSAVRSRDEARAERSRRKFFKGMLKAFNAGLTYREIADISGLSEIRVSQILRQVREEQAQNNGSGSSRRTTTRR